MEKQFWDAARYGKEEEVRKMLQENPNLNVNSGGPDYGNQTALSQACIYGRDKVVTLLLAHPDIDVNQKDNDGSSPFHFACYFGRSGFVRVLLKDARVKFNEPHNNGHTPLYWSAWNGYLEVIKCWIASGREMNLGQPGNENTDAIGVAKGGGFTEVVSLLERFKGIQIRPGTRSERNCSGLEMKWSSLPWSSFSLTDFWKSTRRPEVKQQGS